MRASVPVAYVLLGLELASEHGLSREALLGDVLINPEVLTNPEGRVSLFQCAQLVARVVQQTGDKSLGYEFALRSNLASHGNLGYGVISHPSLGEALRFALKYGRLRNPVLRMDLHVDGARAAIRLEELLPLGPFRQYAIDAVLIGIARLGKQIAGAFRPDLEIHFDCAEPDHFSRYRQRLPKVLFSAPVNQLCFPAEYLTMRLPTGNPSSAQVLTEQCEREMALITKESNLADRVRALLADPQGAYPSLDSAASRLHVSGRTLKRKLQLLNVTYLQLLDEARTRDSMRFLADQSLSINEVAVRLGYTDPASFTRAFRRWTGKTPRDWRSEALVQKPEF